MKTLKTSLYSSAIFLFCTSSVFAQSYTDFYSDYSEHKEEVVTLSDKLNVIKNLYDALGKGDILSIRSMIAEQVDWNGNGHFPYEGRDTHIGKDAVLSSLFDRFHQGFYSWTLDHLTFDLRNDGTVIVKGFYQAKYQQADYSKVEFVHFLKLEQDKVIYFRSAKVDEYVSYLNRK